MRGFPKNLNKKQRIEWAIMDTFDAFSPEFDNPQRLNKVIEMFEEDGCKVTFEDWLISRRFCSSS